MDLEIDLFWSFRSSYSYLGLSRIVELQKKYNLYICVKVVMPLAIRKPDYFNSLPRSRKTYGLLDVQRVAEYNNIQFIWPNPDPVSFSEGKATKDQHLIIWISRLGVLASINKRGLDFVNILSTLIWGSGIKDWDKDDHISNALGKAGFNLDLMNKTISENSDKFDTIIYKNGILLEEAGHWGVPTLVLNGEPFFGQDRLDLFEWRLKKNIL
tara:strand:- start:93 stop:728 length:636 start_codon:yes stop_codon:yes gene_type:complete